MAVLGGWKCFVWKRGAVQWSGWLRQHGMVAEGLLLSQLLLCVGGGEGGGTPLPCDLLTYRSTHACC